MSVLTDGGNVSDDEKTWGILVHISALAGVVIPFGNIIGPLVVWLVKKDEMPFVDENGKNAVNFQIWMTIYFFIAAVTILVLIGFLLLPLLGLVWLILVIVATIRASNKEVYDYPLVLVDFVS